MSSQKRHDVLETFRMSAQNVLIVSLLAGAVGLNLTCASHVIIYDMWFNPSLEEHCIGMILKKCTHFKIEYIEWDRKSVSLCTSFW